MEDGARAEEGDADEERRMVVDYENHAVQNAAQQTRWTWIALAAAGVAAVAAAGSLLVAFLLYRRIRRLESAPSSNLEVSDTLASLARKVFLTERIIGRIDARLAGVVQKMASPREISDTFSRHSQRLSALEAGLKATASRQTHIEQKFEAVAKKTAATAERVSTLHEKLVGTQRFIVDMAQRQKWPWPFNNRIRGLEEEFGLPKK